MPNILAIDQGTTSSRAIIFTEHGDIQGLAQQEFPQHFPRSGWVEHDPEEIWNTTLAVVRDAISGAGLGPHDIASIGITNQRETVIIWDRDTGRPIHPAIVWQDRRTADECEKLRQEGFEEEWRARTGLIIDPYFSATKVKWLLDHVEGARARAERGELAFGTVDTFLLWRLTGGRQHLTDATNASRTALFNLRTQCWDEEMLRRLDIPAAILPEVRDSASDFGVTAADVFGAEVPIGGVAGDQQAALIGQCCFEPGMTKSTYGTGCFVIMNTGDEPVESAHQLLSTVGYRLGGKVTYCLEGSIFVAGAAVQWIRDQLKFITVAAETERIAAEHPETGGVYLVPSFTGLGAPYWDSSARGAIVGLNLDTNLNHIVTATLQSVCYQTRDLMRAMAEDGVPPHTLRVDGGMVVNNWLCQSLSDIVRLQVDRPSITETTALGAAYLAGLQAGIFDSLDTLSRRWKLERTFEPQMPAGDSDALYRGWLEAVARVRSRS